LQRLPCYATQVASANLIVRFHVSGLHKERWSLTYSGDIPYYVFLQRRTYDIFSYVSCHIDNFDTYSIQIESLLVDICSFFDSLCQRFIRELASSGQTFVNGSSIDKFTQKAAGADYFNAGDYRLLLEGDFTFSAKEVNLNAYEDNLYVNPLAFRPTDIKGYTLRPFEEWLKGSSTPWWCAFTSLKHDRLSNMRQATLGNAVDALAATYILLTFRHEQTFKEGRVDAELYKLFVPKYWSWKGRAMPGVFIWS
jgi:hypothetical protein